MTVQWAWVPGYEGRYQVSDQGELLSVAFQQRYLLRTGVPSYRTTKPRILAQQFINSGYLIAHLHMDGTRTAKLVHRIVAEVFCGGLRHGADVNHISGVKSDNRAANLEWLDRTSNHLHAVGLGLFKTAQPVTDPQTGITYPSIAQAAKDARVCPRTVRATFIKEPKRVLG